MSLLHTGQCLERGGENSTRADVLVAGEDDMRGAAGDTVDGDGSDESDDTGGVTGTAAAADVDVTGMNVRLNVRRLRTEGGTPVRNGDESPPTAERVRGRDM